MLQRYFSVLLISLSALIGAGPAGAAPLDLATAADLFTPSFRTGANTTYLGWDHFGDPGDTVINDTTPDLGTASGSFVTTNGEDHQSGSLNYYSSSGSVAESVLFATAGASGSGFTTVIVQAKTLFGVWDAPIRFGPIGGVDPVQVLQGVNATGRGQFFVRYELPGTADPQLLSISSGPQSFVSFDRFVVDTVWSADGFATDSAVETPEPSTHAIAALVAMLGIGGGVGLMKESAAAVRAAGEAP